MTGASLTRPIGALHVDLGRGSRDTVFLAGSGRSGTTWVAQIINHRNDYRFIFEPFHSDRVGLCRRFRRKQYLRPEDRREEYLRPARKILTGEIRSLWTDRFNRRLLARRRLVKDIRANLLVGWLRANFPEMPIILLLRHPCAVATSRLDLGWRDNLAQVMEQEELVEDFLLPLEAEIWAARSAFERHVFVWCIENYVPLRQLGAGEMHLAFYENFLARPEDEVRRLLAYLGERPDERVHRALRTPSPLTHGGETPSLDAWRRSVSGPRLERAVEILALFGLDRVYGDGTMPDPSGALALMGGGARG